MGDSLVAITACMIKASRIVNKGLKSCIIIKEKDVLSKTLIFSRSYRNYWLLRKGCKFVF